MVWAWWQLINWNQDNNRIAQAWPLVRMRQRDILVFGYYYYSFCNINVCVEFRRHITHHYCDCHSEEREKCKMCLVSNFQFFQMKSIQTKKYAIKVPHSKNIFSHQFKSLLHLLSICGIKWNGMYWFLSWLFYLNVISLISAAFSNDSKWNRFWKNICGFFHSISFTNAVVSWLQFNFIVPSSANSDNTKHVNFTLSIHIQYSM